MAEWISRDDLLKVINTNVAEKHNERCSQLLEAILNAPTADVVEVKHGKWTIKQDEYGCEYMVCSCCAEWFYDGDNDIVDRTPNYCPHCGAKMDGERRETNAE